MRDRVLGQLLIVQQLIGFLGFQDLPRPLFVVAVDLDRGTAVAFGDPEHRDIPISRAVQGGVARPEGATEQIPNLALVVFEGKLGQGLAAGRVLVALRATVPGDHDF